MWSIVGMVMMCFVTGCGCADGCGYDYCFVWVVCVCVCIFRPMVGSGFLFVLEVFWGFFSPPTVWWWLAIGCGFLFMFFFLIGGGGWWQQVWVAEKREMLAMSMGEKRKRRRIR